MADEVILPITDAALELKLPEGSDANAPELVEFRKLATDSKLDSKVAQSLFDFHHKTLTGTVDKSLKAMQQKADEAGAATRKQWADAAAQLPEQAKLEVQRVQTKYLDKVPEARDLLEKTGLGNHPAMKKLFAAMGKDLAEDTIANAAVANAAKQRGPAVLHGFTADELKAMYPQSPAMWAPKGS
jgi:hypothetical protein